MAVLEVTLTKLEAFEEAKQYTAPAAITAADDGATIDVAGHPTEKILLIFENGDAVNAENVTIKKGTGIQATADLVIAVPKSEVHVVQVESGKYLNDDGKLVISGSTDVKVAAVALH